jgi:hypothetical protein
MRYIESKISGKLVARPDSNFKFDKIDLARAGWLYNGEGCVSFYMDKQIYKNKKYYYPRVMMVVTQRSPEVLYHFAKFLGFGRVNGPVSNGCKTFTGYVYRWQESKFEFVQMALCLMWPELSSEKKQQAKEVMKNYLMAIHKTNFRRN